MLLFFLLFCTGFCYCIELLQFYSQVFQLLTQTCNQLTHSHYIYILLLTTYFFFNPATNYKCLGPSTYSVSINNLKSQVTDYRTNLLNFTLYINRCHYQLIQSEDTYSFSNKKDQETYKRLPYLTRLKRYLSGTDKLNKVWSRTQLYLF